jgi:predicted transcriptional regulator
VSLIIHGAPEIDKPLYRVIREGEGEEERKETKDKKTRNLKEEFAVTNWAKVSKPLSAPYTVLACKSPCGAVTMKNY